MSRLLIGTQRALLIETPNVYLIDDEFGRDAAAGSIPAVAQPGPGERTVTDGNSKLSIAGGLAVFDTGGVGHGDPSMWYDVQTRTAGMVAIAKWIGTGNVSVGWDSNQAGQPVEAVNLSATNVRAYASIAGFLAVGTVTNGGTYTLASVLRSTGSYSFIIGGTQYPTWTFLWPGTYDSTAALYLVLHTYQGGASCEFVRVPAALWKPRPLAYDSFTRANGVIGSSEATGPDGQRAPVVAWTGGATWTVASGKMVNTPNEGANVVVNGDFAIDSGWTKSEVTITIADGSLTFTNSTQYQNARTIVPPLILGSWYAYSVDVTGLAAEICAFQEGGNTSIRLITEDGTYTGVTRITETGGSQGDITIKTLTANASFVVDNVIFHPLTLSELINTPDLGVANIVAEIEIAVDPAGTQAGLAIGWDSQSSPANGILVYHDGTNVKIDKNVAGTWTAVQSTATTFSANAKLVCVRDGSAVTAYYNNALIGSAQTISDAAILAGTRHGAFCTNATPTMDNVLIFPRTGGNYPDLNRWGGVNP